jgi:uncharacterized protein (TIGR03790 family)
MWHQQEAEPVRILSPIIRYYDRRFAATLIAVLLYAVNSTVAAVQTPELILPRHRLLPAELAVIVNDLDPLSVQIGDYYRRVRGIPAGNLLHVRFTPGRARMPRSEFGPLYATLQRETPEGIQAYAITWAAPYRVDCMSITAAFSFGFDKAYCSQRRCAATRHNPYFASASSAPWDDYGVRPSMALAATGFDQAKALIDRGIQSDGAQPGGTAYLVSTSDKARNVRAADYPAIAARMADWIDSEIVQAEGIQDRTDVLFYFTGKVRVPHLDSLQFVPGAIADHLTSAGGRLTDSRQMSALRWLEAGATGSYGTVVEPCNVRGKFPHPGLLMEAYGAGRTLLEAYWQSVQQPGEGIFIGDPLAAPYDGYRVEREGNQLLLVTRVLQPGVYRLSYATDPVGPFHTLPALLEVGYHQQRFVLPDIQAANYLRLERR